MDLEQKIVAIKIVYCTGVFIFAVIANMIDTENSKWSRKGISKKKIKTVQSIIYGALAVAGLFGFSEIDNVATKIWGAPAHEHQYTISREENRIEPTCTSTGSYNLVYYCAVEDCGQQGPIEEKTLDALGHDYIKRVTNPTCLDSGFTTYICRRCGRSYEDDYVEELGHEYENGLCIRCDEISPTFEKDIEEKVNQYILENDYEKAIELLREALNIMNSDRLQTLYENLKKQQEQKESLEEVPDTEIKTFRGTVEDNQKSTHSFQSGREGVYRFDVSELYSGARVNITIKDGNGNIIIVKEDINNESGFECSLEKNTNYTIIVEGKYKKSDYVLSIGIPKGVVNISDKDNINDSIVYRNQTNTYLFTPSEDGLYRFSFSGMVNQFIINLTILDELGYSETGSGEYSNEEGHTFNLSGGKVYTVQVEQNYNFGSYCMKIDRPVSIQNITGLWEFSGDITYIGQVNKYLYTPSASGNYIFTTNDMENYFAISFSVIDPLNYEIRNSNYVVNNETLKVALEEGVEYTIQIGNNAYDRFGKYRIAIEKQSD